MTINVSDNTPRKSYTLNQGASSQTAFEVDFEFFADADLNVYVNDVKKTLTTHYTTSANSGNSSPHVSGSTGYIHFTTGNAVDPSSAAQVVVITRSIALDRTTDFPASGAFNIGTLNTELDRLVAIHADIDDTSSRGVRLQDSDSAISMELPLLASRKGTVLGFNATTGAAEAGPNITAVQSLADVTTSINLLGTAAVVEDMGLLATSAVIEDMGLLATSANVTAMGLLGVSGVITDMGILGTAAIVEDMGYLGTSANVTAMGHLGTSANVTAMGLLGTSAVVEDMGFLGTSANVTAMGHLGTSGNVTAMGLLGTSAVVTDMGLLGTSANVTAMGHLGTSANVTAMGLLGTSACVADMALLGDSDVIADMALLGTSDVVADMALLGTSDVVADMALLSTSAVVEDMGLLATSANITNMATLGASGVVSNIATVAGSISNVNTAASNIAGVNSFAERYRVGSSDPSSSLDEGDLFYNSTSNALKYYNGSAWATIPTISTGISDGNIPVFTSGVADDDFLRVAGTSIEGRSATEVLSDIGGQASLTFGISNTNAVKIDSASVADDEYARFTANGLESRSTAEVLSDIGGQASLTFGKSDTNALKLEEAVTANDILLAGSSHVKGRTYAELTSDLSLDTVKKQGKETIWIPAAAMYPETTNGCAALAQVELSNGPELKCLDFDASSDEHAQFTIAFPKSWNEGTIAFSAYFTVSGTNTGDVSWALSGVSLSDNGDLNTAFGTAVAPTAKAHSGTSGDLNITAESGAVTIAGSPAAEDLCIFRIMRDVSADDQSGDARLLGIKLYFTTDAANDA